MPNDNHTAQIEPAKPEVEYVAIVGHAGYRVGSDGTVWSQWPAGRRPRGFSLAPDAPWRQLKPWYDNHGYLVVGLGSKYRRRVHQIVATAFHGPCPEGMECRHIDCDKTNNRPDNLAWGSRVENRQDSMRNGTIAHGQRVKGCKLTEDDVREIRRLDESGELTVYQISKRFKVHFSTVLALIRRQTWKHVI